MVIPEVDKDVRHDRRLRSDPLRKARQIEISREYSFSTEIWRSIIYEVADNLFTRRGSLVSLVYHAALTLSARRSNTMSYQHRQSPKQQLSDFARIFPRAAFVTVVALATMTMIFGPTLSNLGVLSAISERVGVTAYFPYFVASWMGLTLYLTSQKAGENVEELEEEAEEAEEAAEEAVEVDSSESIEELKEAAGQMFEGYAMMAHLSLLMSVAALLSAFITSHFAPAFGVLIAVVFPIVEIKTAKTAAWFLSPSALLAFPAFVAVIPITIITILAALSLGTILAISQTLKQAFQSVIKWTIELFQVSYIDTPALDPFQRTFNHRSRR